MLRELENKKLGTNQVEAQSITRQWEREAKKGYQKPRRGFQKDKLFKRDQEYIAGLMKLRSDQARSDWLAIRKEFRELKADLGRISRSVGKSNHLRREVKKMTEKYRVVYAKGCAKNEEKISRLEAKHCSGCRTKTREEQLSMREK